MAFELKEGQGTAWDNRDRKRNPKQPDYRGEIKIGGRMMEIALWVKESRSGKGDFLSVQVSEMRPKGATAGLPRADQTPTPTASTPPSADDGSDIPF